MTTYGVSDDRLYVTISDHLINDSLIKTIESSVTKVVIMNKKTDEEWTERNRFDFQVSLSVWKDFSKNIEHISFLGIFVDNQFTTEHLSCMKKLKFIQIGATDYLLFDKEDTSTLPMIQEVVLWGLGVVHISTRLQEWIDRLRANKCNCEIYLNNLF